jgi:hypothetical protein
MFKDPTIFILGAGASWHYGYPTGEVLVKEVIEKSQEAARYFEHSFRAQNDKLPRHLLERSKGKHQRTLWKEASEECERLRAGLEQVKPLVIDYYLGLNSDLQDIGRLLIAWVILDREHKFQQGKNHNRRQDSEPREDNWCRFIIHQLAIHCKKSKDLLFNPVMFVTFNYDVSLEHALKKGLSHIKMFDDEDVETFLAGSRIVHIYGKVRDGYAPAHWPVSGLQKLDRSNLTEHSAPSYHAQMNELLDIAYDAAKGLRVIDPHDKGANDTDLMMARTAIAKAKRIFILGYGFDEHNSERLGLRDSLAHNVSPGYQSVAFTNYQDIGQINKRASKLFYGNPRNFLTSGHLLADRYEKSVRNTYDALAWDFDLAD